jgi:hypothetical protein
MPRWVLGCPNCKQDFTHSKIDSESEPSFHDPFAWLGEKPKFPAAGVNLECPSCKTTSVYKRNELVYRAD